jgi:4'-phosphopantetheinyl transferase
MQSVTIFAWRYSSLHDCAPYLYGLLLPDEINKASRYVRALDAERYALRQALVRLVLWVAFESVGTPRDLQIDRTCRHCGDEAHGKPRLLQECGDFSVSSTADAVIVAVSDEPIGVDIERLSHVEVPSDSLLSALSCDELNHYFGIRPGNLRQTYLLQAWCRKEAVLKVHGLGLSLDPSFVDVREATPQIEHQGATSLQVVNLETLSPCVGALAAARQPILTERRREGDDVCEAIFGLCTNVQIAANELGPARVVGAQVPARGRTRRAELPCESGGGHRIGYPPPARLE